MTILAIDRYFVGEPNIVGIVTDDNLATITTAGYWDEPSIVASIAAIQNGAFVMSATDLVLMYYAVNQIGIFQFNPVTNTFSTIATSSTGGEVTPQEVQQSAFNVGVDSGTADHYLVALNPAITSYTNGLKLSFRPTHTSLTTAPDINVNGVGVVPIELSGGTTIMAAGDIKLDTICVLEYSTGLGAFVIIDPIFSYANAGDVVSGQNYWFAPDSGAANAYVADIALIDNQYNGFNLDPLILVLQNVAHSNTTASTITITGDGNPPFDILSSTGSALTGGEIVAGGSYFFFFNGINYYLLNAANAGGGGGVTATQVQQAAFNVGADSGVADAYVVTLSPTVSGLTVGLVVSFNPLNTNLTALPTIQVNAQPPTNIFLNDNLQTQVNPGDIVAGQTCNVQYDGTSFILLNPQYSIANYNNLQKNLYSKSTDSGTANSYLWTSLNDFPIPTPDCYGALFVLTNVLHSNTGHSTFQVNGNANAAIHTPDDMPLNGGEILAGKTYFFIGSNTGVFILLNSSMQVSATQVQQSAFNVGVDSGTADNYVITLSPPVLAYTNGLKVAFTPLNTNVTNTPLINIDGVGAVQLLLSNPNLNATPSVAAGDIAVDYLCEAIYNAESNAFFLLNPQFSYANPGDIIEGLNYFVSSQSGGAANDYIATIPYIENLYAASGNYVTPIFLIFSDIGVGNTGPCTVTVTGSASPAIPITYGDGTALVGGEMRASQSYMLYYDTLLSTFIILNPSLLTKIITTPADSQASAITLGSIFTNPLAYDAVYTVYLEIDSATAADVLLGVSITTSPTQQTIISALTVVATIIVPVTIYLPAFSTCLLSTSGTITASISGQIAMPV